MYMYVLWVLFSLENPNTDFIANTLQLILANTNTDFNTLVKAEAVYTGTKWL